MAKGTLAAKATSSSLSPIWTTSSSSISRSTRARRSLKCSADIAVTFRLTRMLSMMRSSTLWEEEPDPPPKEVGCYSHARRNFWDAAVCKHAEGLTGLGLVDAIFAADAPLWKLPPAQRQQVRKQKVLPLVNTFFDWVREEAKQERPRGLVSKALGYALRQEAPLRRFLEDARLKLEN